ncbi:MAG TPA: hypothetical protein VNI57_04195, partial [Candidatus Saccharimonadales bacterium]|nr:hypothetical protein [Candidatus Saccharimonadales bacterium]
MKTLSCVCAAIAMAAVSTATVHASVMKGSGEFRVNAQTAGSQEVPRIATTPDGFVVVWSGAYLDGDGYGSAGRFFNDRGVPAGGDFQVNEWTTGYQAMPSVAADAEGDFLVAWHYEGKGDDFGVFGRTFDPKAASASAEFEVNAWTTSAQFSPSVAGSSSGGFVAVWSSLDQDGSGTGIFGRLVDSTGAPVGGEFQVNTWTTGFQSAPRVAMDEAGDFVVVWQSLLQDGYGYGVYARSFDSTGAPTSPETRVSSFALADDMLPAIGMNRDGEFIVAWQRSESSGMGTDIFAKRFDSAGVASDPEFQVNTYTTGFQSAPSVGIDPFGAFMVAWEDASQDGDGEGVFGRLYDAGGLPAD